MIFHSNASNASKYQIAMDLTLKVEGSLAFCCGNKLLPPFQLQLHCFAEGNNIIEKKLRPWVKKKAQIANSVAVQRCCSALLFCVGGAGVIMAYEMITVV